MSKLGLTPEQKKVVITFWDAVTVEDPREIAFLPTSWSETHAADTGFTNLSDFMNKFFRKTDCPATSAICSTLGGSTNKWDRQDKNKGVIYYQLAASSSEAPVHFNHVAENKAGQGQGISKAWYLRRRFVNPEDSAEVQTMRTELGKLPAGVFKNGITADRILEALKGSRSTSAPARPLLLLPRPLPVTPLPRTRPRPRPPLIKPQPWSRSRSSRITQILPS